MTTIKRQVWRVANFGKGVIDGSQDFYRVSQDVEVEEPTVPTLQEVLQSGNQGGQDQFIELFGSGGTQSQYFPESIGFFTGDDEGVFNAKSISISDTEHENGVIGLRAGITQQSPQVRKLSLIRSISDAEMSLWFEEPSGGNKKNIQIPFTDGIMATREWVEAGITTDFVTIDPSATGQPETQGTMAWDVDNETISVILNGYKMLIGEDQFYPVKNQTGSTITKGTNVKFAGTVGASGRLLIAPFIADGTDPSYVYMGVTAENIANGEDGKVLWFGRLRGINTNAFEEGDILYASTTSAGGFQNTIPTGSNNVVQVAAVINKSSTQGVIFIRPQIEPLLVKPENVANKATNLTSPDNTKYPTTQAVVNGIEKINFYDTFSNVLIWKFYFLGSFFSTAHSLTESGLISRTFTDASPYVRLPRRGYRCPSTAGSTAGARVTLSFMSMNSIEYIEMTFGNGAGAATSGMRFFVGIQDTNADIASNIDYDTLTGIIGVGRIVGSNNLHIIHNDASGTATKIDLGANFPVNVTNSETDSIYKMVITKSGADVIVTVFRLNTSFVESRTLTSDLPVFSDAIFWKCGWNNNTNAVTFDGDLFGVTIKLE
jgi:hypothetical protein